MKISTLKKNQHLLWRAGFGPSALDMATLTEISTQDLWKKMHADSMSLPAYIDVADPELKNAYASVSKLAGESGLRKNAAAAMSDSKAMTSTVDGPAVDDNRRRLAQLSRVNIKTLNLTWLDQMVTGKQQLREKLSLFWHGHFAAVSGNIIHQQKLLDVIRTNALGNFGTLLLEVSKSASMIAYLNNNQNRKNSPNENFAREVMELFTMGRGKYSENDVREAARAFTGWTTNPNGDFIFRSQQHDEKEKTFLGHSGNYNGDDILKIILQQKHTAYFIAGKIYRHFVNDIIHREHVAWLAERFFTSGYDITKLMSDIFLSDWFYDSENIGNHIKSPVELIVGIRRNLISDIQNEGVQLLLQRLLGQMLFYPPNVAGWPGGYNWIDSSSLMLRLQIPKLIAGSQQILLEPKQNDDQSMGMLDPETDNKPKRKSAQLIQATINWQPYLQLLANTRRDQLAGQISSLILMPTITNKEQNIIATDDADSRESFIKSAIISLMCMPEYQLC